MHIVTRIKQHPLIFQWCAIAVLAYVAVMLFSLYVPVNMDELFHYSAISCIEYPLNKLNVFRDASTCYDLALFGGKFLPLRSYAYVGSFPCLIYYPLYKLWPSPYSARYLAILLVGVQAFFLHRLFKCNMITIFGMLLMVMPYAFQHFVDTGPVAYHTASVFIIVYLLREWMRAFAEGAVNAWNYPFLIGIMIFLACWIKLSYVFVLPGIALMIIFHVWENRQVVIQGGRKNTRSLMYHIGVLVVTSTVPIVILLTATTRSHCKYYELFLGDLVCQPSFATSSVIFLRLSEFFTNPLLSAHRLFKVDPQPTWTGGAVLLCVALFVIYGLWQLRQKHIPLGFVWASFTSALIVWGWVSVSPKTWTMHHVVLCFPFFILGAGYIIKYCGRQRVMRVILAVFFLLNMKLYYDLTCVSCYENNHPVLPKLNDYINQTFPHGYSPVILDWGLYMIKALYGAEDQCVLYVEPLDTMARVDLLKLILDHAGRKPVFIGRVDSASDLALVRREFPGLREHAVPFDTGQWRIWEQE